MRAQSTPLSRRLLVLSGVLTLVLSGLTILLYSVESPDYVLFGVALGALLCGSVSAVLLFFFGGGGDVRAPAVVSAVLLAIMAPSYFAMDSAYLRGDWTPALVLYAAGFGVVVCLEVCAVLAIKQGRRHSRGASDPLTDGSCETMEP
jgi:hypothetical protein